MHYLSIKKKLYIVYLYYTTHYVVHFFKRDKLFFRYNGFLPQGDRGRRRSKFMLYKRPMANGVKRSRHYVVKTPHSSQAILDANQHSISYTLSRNHAVIVEYTSDEDTDMFQVKYIFNAEI